MLTYTPTHTHTVTKWLLCPRWQRGTVTRTITNSYTAMYCLEENAQQKHTGLQDCFSSRWGYADQARTLFLRTPVCHRQTVPSRNDSNHCPAGLKLHRTRIHLKIKKALRETKTLRAGRSNAQPKIFTPPQTPFPGSVAVWLSPFIIIRYSAKCQLFSAHKTLI